MGEKHDKARGMVEQGIDAMAEGDQRRGQALIETAKAVDPSAAPEVARDIAQERKQAENFVRKNRSHDDKRR